MRRSFLCRRLTRRPRWQALIGVGISLLFGVGLALVLWDAGQATIFDTMKFVEPALFMAGGLAVGVLLTVLAAIHLSWVYEHGPKDFRALGRYGPTREVAAAIDAEVLARRRLVRLGTPATFLNPFHEPGELYGHQVILTESWLLDFWYCEGNRFKVMRFADLVWALRESPPGRAKLVLIDRHDARLEVAGTPAAVERLRAEVLARAPWVLERVDAAAERAWGQDRTGILADVDRRREAIQLAERQRSAETGLT
jgi:hypothetical protein